MYATGIEAIQRKVEGLNSRNRSLLPDEILFPKSLVDSTFIAPVVF